MIHWEWLVIVYFAGVLTGIWWSLLSTKPDPKTLTVEEKKAQLFYPPPVKNPVELKIVPKPPMSATEKFIRDYAAKPSVTTPRPENE